MVRNSFGDCPVNTRFNIRDFPVSPVAENASSEFGAPPVAAAIIDCQNHVAICGKNLPFPLKRVQAEGQPMLVLPVQTAMNPYDQRILSGSLARRRLDHE